MRWVKETLPSPLRCRYPLITLRLTSSSLAGTLRKLVAVGTVRLRAMLAAIVAPTPLIGWPSSLAGLPGCPGATGVADPPGSFAERAGASVDDFGAGVTAGGGAVGTVAVAPLDGGDAAWAGAGGSSSSLAAAGAGAEAWAWSVGFDDL